jgi:NitT/TauT family transport system substrate-binding protein
MRRKYWVGGILVLLSLSLALWAGFGARAGAATKTASSHKLTKVTLQLKWVAQAQFAGYYAAKAKGFYKANGLDVNLKLGGPDITPEQVVASGQAEFGIDWLPSLLATRDTGTDIVNIAQVFTRSGMTELAFKDTGINSIAKMRGKTVGVWCCGNQFELFAALTKNGMDPTHNKGVKIFNQPFDMNAFLSKQIQAASAMTYNELAQVLESKNPKTGKLYTLNDLNVIKLESVGTGMLEDGIFTKGDWIKSKANQQTAIKFLAASFQGWAYCRDHLQECTNIVLSNGTTLGRGHQLWQANEVNALIWPVPQGIGVMNRTSFVRTANIALKFKVIKKPATNAAYRTDLAIAADKLLAKKNVDVNGVKWRKSVVHVTAGGK